MRFLFYFRLSAYAFIGSGFVALLVADEYGILSALLFAALLFLGWQIDSGRLRHALPRWFWNVITVAFCAFCIADALMIRRQMALALVDFLIFLQAVKLLNPKQDRDYIALYLLSFFALLISSILTFSSLFGLACVLFIITATWALMTWNLKRDIQAYLPKERHAVGLEDDEHLFSTPAIDSLLSLRFFSGTVGITLMTCILAAGVFLILPRMQEGMFFSYAGENAPKVSGFSEEMALDSFGNIRLDYTPVMHVELPGITDESQLSHRLYWKGATYDEYDGKRWKSTATAVRPIQIFRRYRSRAWLRQSRQPWNLLEQRFTLLTPEFHVLFGANKLYGVEGRFLTLEFSDLTDNANVNFSPYALQYSAFSDISRPAEDALQHDHQVYPDEIRHLYLQTPELSDKIAQLARDIAQNQANPYDMAAAVNAYLQHNYTYSLHVARSPAESPLDDFLFISKAGHCEYYATSMAILLRLLGIPARVANGFAQGRWNEFGRFFTVRQSDAHAWVEVYFPSYGWITFDPTPPSAFGEEYQQFAEQSGFFASLYQYSEYIRTKWNRYVIDYSLYDQSMFAIEAFRASHSARDRIAAAFRRLQQNVRSVVATFSLKQIALYSLVLVGIGTGMRLLLQRLGWLRIAGRFHLPHRRHARQTDVAFYREMLEIFAHKGIKKQAHLTPEEFVEDISQRYPDYAQDIADLTSLYYAARYGQYVLQQEEQQQTVAILQRLRKIRR
ncbi:hypothetical protein U14_03801 [Candidatus Moduliflexus flocculans]|uniref:Transglutaminase-like domain-containing protein n=1 Tax=Candidatus Moduliflexus flocculans TaxID=1499966 RepID=A0A081BQ83_9BACT|nr:hypothetical protein U14_03801 [Candidatus Moduliflexus flocculans]